MVVFMASAILLIKTRVSSEVLESSEEHAIKSNYAPRPLSQYAKYLSDCAAKLYPHCGSQIFSGIFFGNETVSVSCCLNLVYDMDKPCHDSLTKYNLIISTEFKQKEAKILQRSNQIWKYCLDPAYYIDDPKV